MLHSSAQAGSFAVPHNYSMVLVRNNVSCTCAWAQYPTLPEGADRSLFIGVMSHQMYLERRLVLALKQYVLRALGPGWHFGTFHYHEYCVVLPRGRPPQSSRLQAKMTVRSLYVLCSSSNSSVSLARSRIPSITSIPAITRTSCSTSRDSRITIANIPT